MARTYRNTPWNNQLRRRKNNQKYQRDGVRLTFGCSNKTGRKNSYWRKIDRMYMDTKDRLLNQAMAYHFEKIEEFKRKYGFWNEGHELTCQEKRKKIDEMESLLGVGFKSCMAGDGPIGKPLECLVEDYITAGIHNGYRLDVIYMGNVHSHIRRNRQQIVKLIKLFLALIFPLYDLVPNDVKYMIASWFYRNRTVYDNVGHQYIPGPLCRTILKWKVLDTLSSITNLAISRSLFTYESPMETWSKLMMIQKGSYNDNQLKYELRGEYDIRPGLPYEIWEIIYFYLRDFEEKEAEKIDHEGRFLLVDQASSYQL